MSYDWQELNEGYADYINELAASEALGAHNAQQDDLYAQDNHDLELERQQKVLEAARKLVTTPSPIRIFHVYLHSTQRTGERIQVRPVSVPIDELACEVGWRPDIRRDLDVVFKYGQNDIQPLPFCSVSVGDVILFDNVRYRVARFGFDKL